MSAADRAGAARAIAAHWPAAEPAPARPRARLFLLGTGQVGRALLARLAGMDPAGRPLLVALANSRASAQDGLGIAPALALARLRPGNGEAGWLPAFAGGAIEPDAGVPIIVDATASDDVADRHAGWLARGVHVVSANKLGPGAAQSRADSIASACSRAGTCYGIAATVGAGLPVLASIDRLRQGGDAIDTLQGVLSGTLAWLFERFDGAVPFSQLVRQAQALGYAEPDPWQDLSGRDVLRKLLILARACGHRLDADAVDWRPLLPSDAGPDGDRLDAVMAKQLAAARAHGGVLRYVATLGRDGRASVGLQALAPTHPLAAPGCCNRVLVHSSRYREQPLLIQGPGAGADVTAAALLDQVLAIAQGPRMRC
jgi:homoserine dehydrogenase